MIQYAKTNYFMLFLLICIQFEKIYTPIELKLIKDNNKITRQIYDEEDEYCAFFF